MSTQWFQPQDCPVPDFHLKNWLLDTGSLTERLQAHCRDFRVRVLGQQPAPLLDNEQELMGHDTPYVVREVLLCAEQTPWVFARSLLPSALCETGGGELSALGDKPLGRLLFNDPRFIRQPFQLTCIQPRNKLQQQLRLAGSQTLWGRRSVFLFQQWRLMVAEVFLPQCPAYKLMGRTI
ncbi:chorismate--pyruvate lyase family protein [Lacimicrobium alkaliphilum]|uniref:chorismate--pyruvate lyase family protein n=1 Tax=Lacimicrobium alkaliphilum TaxID=1526571 RepID=UPI002467FED6|nr:chorismate lyase [Lacimicrobium alkaliphilum]